MKKKTSFLLIMTIILITVAGYKDAVYKISASDYGFDGTASSNMDMDSDMPADNQADGQDEDDMPMITPTPELEPTPTSTPTPEPTPTPTPTLEPTPEPEPEPTFEPEPIIEPEPTLLPTPTAAPNSIPTSSRSSIPIPKSNSNLTKYGKLMPPNGDEDEKYQYLLGTDENYYTYDEPPKGYRNEAEAASHMITITVPVWRMSASGNKYSSRYDVTINTKLAANVKAIFDEIYKLPIKFPIKLLKGYGYREVGGVGLNAVTLMSMHSFGAAIDINPGDYDNDYFLGKGNDLRDKSNPYCIPDEVIEIFVNYGWNWGGNFNICSDTMHFQYLGLDFLSYQGNSPFKTLSAEKGYIIGKDVWNLQSRLKELGYKVNVDGVYGAQTASVVKKFQKSNGLEATGIVNYETWEKLINLTHYLSYVF